jgi:hypothetical protein
VQREQQFDEDGSAAFVDTSAACQNGYRVTGGGGRATWTDSSGTHDAVLLQSYPILNDVWWARVGRPQGGAFPNGSHVTVDVYAICVQAS